MGGDQGETEQEGEETSILAQELNEQKKYFNQQFGFHKMVKDISEYTMTPFFELMDKSAIEVLFIASMMIEESELNQFQSNRREN